MRRLLAAHDEVLRQAIEAHGGWIFKHTGDGGVRCIRFAEVCPSMLQWRRSGHWSRRCGWGSRPAKPSCAGANYFGAVLDRAEQQRADRDGVYAPSI